MTVNDVKMDYTQKCKYVASNDAVLRYIGYDELHLPFCFSYPSYVLIRLVLQDE